MAFFIPVTVATGDDVVDALPYSDTPPLLCAPPAPLPSSPHRTHDPFDGALLVDTAAPRAPLPQHMKAFRDAACESVGADAEAAFLAIAAARGWTPRLVTAAQTYDYNHHVDCLLRREGQELWVDVKAPRALRRGAPPQVSFIFVELHATGWLLRGRADVIAVRIATGAFALLDRLRLVEYAHSVLRTDYSVAWPEQSLFRCYSRTNSRYTTAMTLVPIAEAYAAAGAGVWGDARAESGGPKAARECE